MGWNFYAPGALRATKFVQPLFLVEPIIPTGGIVVLHGPPTAGKTQFALTLAKAVTDGAMFLDEYRCRRGSVLFIETDISALLLQSRLAAAPETDSISFLCADPFDVVRIARDDTLPTELIEAQASQPSLVIVDTLRKTSTQDEIDPAAPTRVYQAWRKLFPGATLMLLHHDRKQSTNPNVERRPEEEARGTGAWIADASTGIHLTRSRTTDEGGHLATLSFSKCSTCEVPPPMTVKMHADSLLIEPAKPTARRALWLWKQSHPEATPEQARNFLQLGKFCGRTMAYRLASEMQQNEKS